MNLFRLDTVSPEGFEKIVVSICEKILGMGTFSFSKGKDGGRDAKFTGTANSFPSKKNPASGKFIIQAKHTSSPDASCSHSQFKRIVEQEIPKIKALVESKECDNYIIFTNRKMSAGTNSKLTKMISKKTGVAKNWLLGIETIDRYLNENPQVQRIHSLGRSRMPFRIDPEQLAKVIESFYLQRENIKTAFDSAHAFSYTDMQTKNNKNHLSNEYYKYIRESSEPYFENIREFLNDPKNTKLQKCYHNTADELKQKLITFRSKFDNFDEALTFIYDSLKDSDETIRENAKLSSIFLHYMYCNCDIGESDA